MLALVSGTLARAPERRTSKTGRLYVTTSICVVDGGASTWWNVLAFDENICVELAQLDVGDAISATGAMRAEVWEPEAGRARVNLSLVATNIAALRPVGQKVKPHSRVERHAPSSNVEESGEQSELNDDIPF